MHIDVRLAPSAATSRVASSINLPKKRAFGLLKMRREYIGAVSGNEFEIWERSERAIHLRGRVRARRGGARIEVRYRLPEITALLIGVFFVVYTGALIALVSSRPGGTGGWGGALVLGCVAVVAALFAAQALRQRADLRSFLEGLFEDARRD